MPDEIIPDLRQYLRGPTVIKLSDSAGLSAVVFKNAAGQIIALLKSNGNFYVTGEVVQVDPDTLVWPPE